MKICILSGDTPFTVHIPSRLIFNGFTATLAAPAFLYGMNQKHTGFNIQLNSSAARTLFREINRCRKQHPDWCLLEVETAGKPTLQIRL